MSTVIMVWFVSECLLLPSYTAYSAFVTSTTTKQEGPWALGRSPENGHLSQSQAMNFNRSVVSLRLNIDYVDKINRVKGSHFSIANGANFGP